MSEATTVRARRRGRLPRARAALAGRPPVGTGLVWALLIGIIDRMYFVAQ